MKLWIQLKSPMGKFNYMLEFIITMHLNIFPVILATRPHLSIELPANEVDTTWVWTFTVVKKMSSIGKDYQKVLR